MPQTKTLENTSSRPKSLPLKVAAPGIVSADVPSAAIFWRVLFRLFRELQLSGVVISVLTRYVFSTPALEMDLDFKFPVFVPLDQLVYFREGKVFVDLAHSSCSLEQSIDSSTCALATKPTSTSLSTKFTSTITAYSSL
jgi:hypothetical protein